MKKKDAIKYFGSISKVARRLGISRQAVFKWPEVIPECSALRLDRKTKGKLKYYEKTYRANKKA